MKSQWKFLFSQILLLVCVDQAKLQAQALPTTAQPSATNAEQNTNPSLQKAAEPQKWYVRDPATGRVFEQQVISVNVPTTRMEAKTIVQPIYEPRTVIQQQQVPQTVFVPTTQYVMQPRLRGWWNPLKQPVQGYEYVPVTSWTPRTETVTRAVAVQQWTVKAQPLVVYQPVQTSETRQQLVQREVPQSSLPASRAPTALVQNNQPLVLPAVAPSYNNYAATAPILPPPARKPLFTVPILAQQRILPWQPLNSTAYNYPAMNSNRIGNSLRPALTNNPVTSAIANNYSAPLRTANVTYAGSTRDFTQAGMAPTVLR